MTTRYFHTPPPEKVQPQPKSTRVLFRVGLLASLSLNAFTLSPVPFRSKAPFAVQLIQTENYNTITNTITNYEAKFSSLILGSDAC